MTAVAPMCSVGSTMTESRWTGTETVPPIAMLAPNATCTVPSIFSSSSTIPVSVAFSLVPTPSSARFVPSSPALQQRGQQLLALVAARAREPAVLDGQVAVAEADPGEAGDDQPAASR